MAGFSTTFCCPMCEEDISFKALIGHIPTCYHRYCVEINIQPYCTCHECQGKQTHPCGTASTPPRPNLPTSTPSLPTPIEEDRGEQGKRKRPHQQVLEVKRPSKQRRKKKRKNKKTKKSKQRPGRGLTDMPSEVLFHIATACAPADVEALGATCTMMRTIVGRDETVWRRLFERDHAARLYGYQVASLLVPYPPSRSRWPDEALKACARDVASLADHPPVLPEAEIGKRPVPAPLAHLIAAGKTWRWVYIAHARAVLSTIISDLPLQPGTLPSGPPKEQCGRMCLFVGDVVDGKRHGLGVELDLQQLDIDDDDEDDDDDEEESKLAVVFWAAGVWANDRINGWCVTSGTGVRQMGVAVDGEWSGLSFRVLPQMRAWGRTTAAGAQADPWFALYERGEFRRTYVPTEDKNVIKETLWTPYYEGDFANDRKRGGRHGQAMIRFHNGDVVMQRWRDNDLVGIDDLVCSMTCPIDEFAGRTLGAGAKWRVSWFDLNVDGWRDNAYWPEGGDEAEEKAFWRYVALDLIGWSELVCAHALANAPYAIAHKAELAALAAEYKDRTTALQS